MTWKPLKEWKTLTKCIFLMVGFLVAMALFPTTEKPTVEEDPSLEKEETAAVFGEDLQERRADADFFSEFRADRLKQRGEQVELYQGILDDTTVSQEKKEVALANLENLYQKSHVEEKVESILKGRQYEDVIFSYEDNLSLLMIKGKELSKEEKASLASFVTVYCNVKEENLTIFSIL